jgi:hypothetical protein
MATVALTTVARECKNAPNAVGNVGPIVCPTRAHQYDFLHHPGQDLGNLESLGNNSDPGRLLCGEKDKWQAGKLNHAHANNRAAALTELVQEAFQNVESLFE